MTLNIGTNIKNDFPGCILCCDSIRPPGTIVDGSNKYPDRVFYATESSNFNVFSTNIRDYFTLTSEADCPPTSCVMQKGA
jgi:hypothetical protein